MRATVRRLRGAEAAAEYERGLARGGFQARANARTGKTRWQHTDGRVAVVYREAAHVYVAIEWAPDLKFPIDKTETLS